jgi:hypothetical protein
MNSVTHPQQAGNDPLLDEIRAIKQSVSERAGHDVAALCRELRQEQKSSGHRIVRQSGARAQLERGR